MSAPVLRSPPPTAPLPPLPVPPSPTTPTADEHRKKEHPLGDISTQLWITCNSMHNLEDELLCGLKLEALTLEGDSIPPFTLVAAIISAATNHHENPFVPGLTREQTQLLWAKTRVVENSLHEVFAKVTYSDLKELE
ncbi:hypothetical protein K439DRAFT_1613785 [Ramaria rubella]|nr:hypothetical protein K439DRAFT_1613785 [Ramaria rubella]